MINSSGLNEEKIMNDNIFEDVTNLFRLKTEIDDTTIKDVRNLLRTKKNYTATQLKM